MSNLNHTIPTDDLVRAGYHERLVIEIDRRDPELMSLVIVKRTLLNHSIATVNLDGGSEVSETSRETSAVTSDRDSSAEASTTADISTPDGLTALATLNAKRAIEISPVVAAILARTNINVSTRTNPTSHGQRPANSGSTSIVQRRSTQTKPQNRIETRALTASTAAHASPRPSTSSNTASGRERIGSGGRSNLRASTRGQRTSDATLPSIDTPGSGPHRASRRDSQIKPTSTAKPLLKPSTPLPKHRRNAQPTTSAAKTATTTRQASRKRKRSESVSSSSYSSSDSSSSEEEQETRVCRKKTKK